jgi:hypothetical protein
VDTGVSVYMHMFDAREIEDSLCNTCHECGFSTHLEEHAIDAEHATLQMQREYAATMLRKAQRDAEKKQHMLGANVALTMADLEDMHKVQGHMVKKEIWHSDARTC